MKDEDEWKEETSGNELDREVRRRSKKKELIMISAAGYLWNARGNGEQLLQNDAVDLPSFVCQGGNPTVG